MDDRTAARRRLVRFTAALCVALAGWNGLVVPRLPGHPTSSVVANVVAAGAVLAAARRTG